MHSSDASKAALILHKTWQTNAQRLIYTNCHCYIYNISKVKLISETKSQKQISKGRQSIKLLVKSKTESSQLENFVSQKAKVSQFRTGSRIGHLSFPLALLPRSLTLSHSHTLTLSLSHSLTLSDKRRSNKSHEHFWGLLSSE